MAIIQKTKKATWLKKVQYIATALVFMLGIADAIYLIFWYGKEPIIEQPQLDDFSLHLTDATGAVARVVNGGFEGDRLSVHITHTATADLNNDGLIDAAVVAEIKSGETENSQTLFLLLNSGHGMVNTDQKTLTNPTAVNRLEIKGGKIKVSNPLQTTTYRLLGIRLEEVTQPSLTP
jgi:hypothetical protein